MSYPLLLLGRLITALGAAAGLSCTFMLLNELLSREQASQAMPFTLVSFTVGIASAVTLGGIITQYLHWQDCFILLLIHGIAMFCLTWQFSETLKQKIPLHPLNILRAYQHALKNSKLIMFSFIVALTSAVGYCYAAAAPLYTQLELNLSPDIYGYWNLINMIGMLGSGFLGAYLMKKCGPRSLLFIGFTGMIPCLISLIFISTTHMINPTGFFIATMFLYLASGLLFPAASFFSSNAIDDRASAASMMSFINMGAAMVAVIIMGYLPLSIILSFTVTIPVASGFSGFMAQAF